MSLKSDSVDGLVDSQVLAVHFSDSFPGYILSQMIMNSFSYKKKDPEQHLLNRCDIPTKDGRFFTNHRNEIRQILK